MKTKIDTTATITLDEIIYQLRENLSTNELANFAIQIGDGFTEDVEYYEALKKKLNTLKL